MLQSTISLALIKNGSLLILTGLLWGTVIHRAPHPRIALSTHMTLLQHGLLNIAAGLILAAGVAKLKNWQLWTVSLPHFALWGLHAVGTANAWWGANKATEMVRNDSKKEAGGTKEAGRAKDWQEKLAVLVYGIVFFLIPAWAVLASVLFEFDYSIDG